MLPFVTVMLEDVLVSAAMLVLFEFLLLPSWIVSGETRRISKEIGGCFSFLTPVSFQNLPEIMQEIRSKYLCIMQFQNT